MTNQPITPTESVSLTAVAAPHMIASAIYGASHSVVVVGHGIYAARVFPGRVYTELSFVAEDGSRPNWATVTILIDEREHGEDGPHGIATVTHSSSSSDASLDDSIQTARVLTVAVEAAKILNRWAA